MCEHFYFVVRGCLRLYKLNDNGVYHVLQFATANYWMIDLATFHKKTRSVLNIDALEDAVVLRITYDGLIDLYMKASKFDRIFRVLLENHLMQAARTYRSVVQFSCRGTLPALFGNLSTSP